MEYLILPSFILGCILTYFGMKPEIRRLEEYCRELRGRENFRIGYRDILPAIKDAQNAPQRKVAASEPIPDLLELQKEVYYAD